MSSSKHDRKLSGLIARTMSGGHTSETPATPAATSSASETPAATSSASPRASGRDDGDARELAAQDAADSHTPSIRDPATQAELERLRFRLVPAESWLARVIVGGVVGDPVVLLIEGHVVVGELREEASSGLDVDQLYDRAKRGEVQEIEPLPPEVQELLAGGFELRRADNVRVVVVHPVTGESRSFDRRVLFVEQPS